MSEDQHRDGMVGDTSSVSAESSRKSGARRPSSAGRSVDVWFILFLGVLGVCYIWMRNYYEQLWRREQALEEEVRNLHSESTTLSADLMSQSKESEVVRLLERRAMDLEESQEPPVKVEYRAR